jgi:predicted DNA binding CopG/RHH family protein
MRLPETLLADLKRLANEQDVPYQSLMKVYLAERVAEERRHRRRKANV